MHSRLKALLDYSGAAIALLALSPVMVAVALAIRLTSPGPVLFHQARIGKDHRVYICYKFRTMIPNAPRLTSPDGRAAIVTEKDPRVTAIGRFLRRTSLDELPQLFNVLRGEMSLVGPRPEQPDGVQTYEPRHFSRLKVKPGLTGWAVIHGRNAIPVHVRRDMDAWYAENRSFWLDIRILWRTIRLVARGEGIDPTEATLGARERRGSGF